MASINLEKEVLEALQCIKNGENFIIEGGAGSGKTYSLISLINILTEDLPNIRIVCITYTNNAVAEILSRIENKNLRVSTIHDFIWSLIGKFQNEIKNVLIDLINDEGEKIFKKPKDYGEDLICEEYFQDLYVDYDEYYAITPNDKNVVKISHDHILIVAEKIFEKYKKISDILKDIADCIFVDEYQDTSPLVGNETDDFISIKKKAIFDSWDFSDGKQTKELRLTHKYNAEMAGFEDLYDLYNADLITTLISKIKGKIDKGCLDNDKTLGALALEEKPIFNKEDLLDQINRDDTYQSIYSILADMSWGEAYAKCRITKESLMSYKLNGMSGKYEANSYRDRILCRLDILEEIIELYEGNKFNDFLRITKFSISNREDKICLKQAIDYLVKEDDKTIEEVLVFAEDQGLLEKDDLFDDCIINKGFYLWERIKNITFKQYRKSVLYLKEFSPICTQHSVKGSEYDNVLLVLESNWNKYDFYTLFGKGSLNHNVRMRTKKLFYVCITRAKKNLVIYLPIQDSEILDKAKEFFGEENVLPVSSID